ncbi:hypothetical protein K501DRAFT_206498 [Backusella circina FSU 941]|nr:hypothetical protein K501DRAFT_206498 [Backusella circina FSU 941]
MPGHSIETNSYSEAMDLSDLDGYDPRSPSPVLTETEQDTPPVKIRKKPGRKPNPASPALRKAQNRAAQRAFRERKERHMKDLESNIRRIKEAKEQLEHDNYKLKQDNEILKSENWYLKGIVLSLQLVCLQHNLVIPQHCPHVDKKTLSVLAQSIPASISSYLNVSSRNKLDLSQNYQGISSSANIQESMLPNPYQQQVTPNLPQGSLIITQDGVQTVEKKATSRENMSSGDHHPWFQDQEHNNKSSDSIMKENNNSGIDFGSIPPLSPMPKHARPRESPPQPTPIPSPSLAEPATSNLAAIQALRLRLRLQSACVRMQSVPFAIQPTLLQLTIPHDPRIDLIPTPHMRDRMILFRDQFDLDDCFRCLLSGSVFHGGDPAIAGNWQLPAEFFEKYWYLTIDYNLRRCTNEWRKKQGLKELAVVPNESLPQNLSYDELSQYLGMQLPTPSQKQANAINGDHRDIPPIQLTNGYGTLPEQQRPQNSQWQNIMMGTKNYDMMMTGLYEGPPQ